MNYDCVNIIEEYHVMSYQCQTLIVKLQMSNVKCQISNVKCQMSIVKVKCQMSNDKYQMSKVKCHIQGVSKKRYFLGFVHLGLFWHASMVSIHIFLSFHLNLMDMVHYKKWLTESLYLNLGEKFCILYNKSSMTQCSFFCWESGLPKQSCFQFWYV